MKFGDFRRNFGQDAANDFFLQLGQGEGNATAVRSTPLFSLGIR